MKDPNAYTNKLATKQKTKPTHMLLCNYVKMEGACIHKIQDTCCMLHMVMVVCPAT